MFIDRLTFDEIDKVLEKVLNVVFNDERFIDYVMKTKTTAIIRDIVEVSFKWGEELYTITFDDFNVDFSFDVKTKDQANRIFRATMAKIFIKNRRSLSAYLTKLDEYQNKKWNEELTIIEELTMSDDLNIL